MKVPFTDSLKPASSRTISRYRALAMVYSDAWVLSERNPHDPRLKQEEDELIKSYTALRQVVNREGGRL